MLKDGEDPVSGVLDRVASAFNVSSTRFADSLVKPSGLVPHFLKKSRRPVGQPNFMTTSQWSSQKALPRTGSSVHTGGIEPPSLLEYSDLWYHMQWACLQMFININDSKMPMNILVDTIAEANSEVQMS